MVRGCAFAAVLIACTWCISAQAQKRKPLQPADTSIRSVDFRNFSYAKCDGPDIQLRNGRDRYGDTEVDSAELKSVRYVDFDGDGRQEAFVIVEWSTSGSAGGGVNAYVYAIRGSSPLAIWSRCDQKSSVSLVGKAIKFTYPEYVGDDPNCCPTYTTVDTITWRGRGFIRVAKKRTHNGY